MLKMMNTLIALIRWLKNSLARTNTYLLSITPGFLGLCCLFLLTIIAPGGYSGLPIQDFLIILAFFLMGCMGLPIIIRKEYPFSFFNLEGPFAVLNGIVYLVMGWGIAFVAIYFKFLKR
jgi:hypothetical protein